MNALLFHTKQRYKNIISRYILHLFVTLVLWVNRVKHETKAQLTLTTRWAANPFKHYHNTEPTDRLTE